MNFSMMECKGAGLLRRGLASFRTNLSIVECKGDDSVFTIKFMVNLDYLFRSSYMSV